MSKNDIPVCFINLETTELIGMALRQDNVSYGFVGYLRKQVAATLGIIEASRVHQDIAIPGRDQVTVANPSALPDSRCALYGVSLPVT
jgi:hypothetical protein